MDGREMEVCVKDAAETLSVPENYIQKLVDGWLNNPDILKIKSSNHTSLFPPYLLVEESNYEAKKYDFQTFLYDELDTVMKRHCTPSALTLMLNNTCVTKCVYCYQDKRKVVGCSIPFERIRQIVQEAASLHVVNFDVIGGEFFLYPHWKELLKDLREMGFQPYLSTKIPIQEEDVKYLSDLKIMDLQLSIDSFIPSHISKSLGTKEEYCSKMRKTLDLLDQYGIPAIIHSVLTKYTDSIEDMQSVYDELCKHNNIVEWKVVKGEATLYPQVEFSKIESSNDKLQEINQFLTKLKSLSSFNIFPPYAPQEKISTETPELKDQLNDFLGNNRSFCSGLFSHLYILPDGNVTMCEQLYWDKNFIVGNVIDQTVEEVWNSPEALGLYEIRQEDIPSDSLCSTCNYFKKCREIRQVCYREIIAKYGRDKWYYPDVNCPLAKKNEELENKTKEM